MYPIYNRLADSQYPLCTFETKHINAHTLPFNTKIMYMISYIMVSFLGVILIYHYYFLVSVENDPRWQMHTLIISADVCRQIHTS